MHIFCSDNNFIQGWYPISLALNGFLTKYAQPERNAREKISFELSSKFEKASIYFSQTTGSPVSLIKAH